MAPFLEFLPSLVHTAGWPRVYLCIRLAGSLRATWERCGWLRRTLLAFAACEGPSEILLSTLWCPAGHTEVQKGADTHPGSRLESQW